MPLTFSPERAKEARKRADLGQRQAARLLGLARQTILNAENGDSTPGGDTLARMADLYGVEVGFFFIDTPEPTTGASGRGTNDQAPTADSPQSSAVGAR